MSDFNSEPVDARRLELRRHREAASRARRFVARLLHDNGIGEVAVDRAVLAASELVTNAFKHGEGTIELRASLHQDRVRIEVIDEGRDRAPAVREKRAEEIGGWGLRIVDQLALQWGVFEGTTHVWADLALV